jgi:hypothetical protein
MRLSSSKQVPGRVQGVGSRIGPGGFQDVETPASIEAPALGSWRWCRPAGSLTIEVPNSSSRHCDGLSVPPVSSGSGRDRREPVVFCERHSGRSSPRADPERQGADRRTDLRLPRDVTFRSLPPPVLRQPTVQHESGSLERNPGLRAFRGSSKYTSGKVSGGAHVQAS